MFTRLKILNFRSCCLCRLLALLASTTSVTSVKKCSLADVRVIYHNNTVKSVYFRQHRPYKQNKTDRQTDNKHKLNKQIKKKQERQAVQVKKPIHNPKPDPNRNFTRAKAATWEICVVILEFSSGSVGCGFVCRSIY